MAQITAKFEFDELNIPVLGRLDSGIMISGRAELEGDEEDFQVTTVFLEDGTCLSADMGEGSPFEAELFNRIASIIHNEKSRIGRYAVVEWSEAVATYKEAA